MIKYELTHHKLAYGFLSLALVIFLVGFFAFWPDRAAQRVLVALLVIFYTIWGAITHLKAEHITKHIIYEYLGVASLAGILLWLVTL